MRCFVLVAALLITGCHDKHISAPSKADIAAVTTPKPKPTAAILVDHAANDRYNAAIEGWGERLRAAGLRICNYYKDMGLDVECD